MLFDLINASATFQTYINKSLTGLINNFCVVYLDDILIYSSSQEEHLDHVKQVLERLRRFSLYVSLKKCEFFTTEVEFLDFIIFIDSVTMNKRRVKAIQKWSRPKSFHEVQVFLSFVNFYRRFIHYYSQIAESLTNLLKGSIKGIKIESFDWSVEAKKTFRRLREAFTKAPLLYHFDSELLIRVKTNALDFDLTDILTQLQNNNKQ